MSEKDKEDKQEQITFAVKITAPDGLVFEGDADFLLAPGKEGVLGIGPHHTKTVSLLRKGDVVVKNNASGEHTFSLEEGVIQVNRDGVEILITA